MSNIHYHKQMLIVNPKLIILSEPGLFVLGLAVNPQA